MTQEQEDLLLKDLCARLPYGVKFMIDEVYLTEDMIKGGYGKTQELYGITREGNIELLNMDYHMPIESIKPYLFPISSMTKEQESYIYFNTKFRTDMFKDLALKIDKDDNYVYTDIFDYTSLIDWLNKNHFDYRGLIDNGLAIDATGLNIY